MGLIRDLGEQGIIELFCGAEESGLIAKSVGDDCAALRLKDGELLLWTADMLVEGVHFKRYLGTAEQLGAKSLAVNLSDIAAMGGAPLGCLISLSLPPSLEESWLKSFRDGFNRAAGEYGCPLIGGDTCGSADKIAISVTVLGRVGESEVLWRDGAGDGDDIWISGVPGTSALGLRILMDGATDRSAAAQAAVSAHVHPRAMLDLGSRLAGLGCVTACIDTSDGLSIDLNHLVLSSGVGALLREESIPLPEIPDGRDDDPLQLALGGGEDYHLLFAARADGRSEIERLGCAHRLGEFRSDVEGVRLEGKDGSLKEVAPVGYSHF